MLRGIEDLPEVGILGCRGLNIFDETFHEIVSSVYAAELD
jgi:hypothetical protein